MGTIGYGDIVPVTLPEKLMVIMMIFVSTGVYGYTLNSINNILNDMKKLNLEKMKGIFTINKYMKKKSISKALQSQVVQYLNYVMQETKEDRMDEMHILA